jgi:hypothetical protein
VDAPAPAPVPVPVNDAAPVPPAVPAPPVPPAPPVVAAAPVPGAWSANAYGPGAVSPAAAPVATWAPPVAPPQNVLAWVSFGLGLGAIMMGLVTSIPAIILGHIARRQIRERGEQGDGAALTGLIAGYVFTALWVLGIAAYIAFIVFVIAAAGASSGFATSL